MTDTVKQSLFWRLTSELGEGQKQVSMVLPADAGEEFLLETDIISSRKDNIVPVKHPHSIPDLKWSEDDLTLFTSLVKSLLAPEDQHGSAEQMALDLTDENVVSIVHIVAAARFATPLPTDELVDEIRNVIRQEYDLGDLAAIHTRDGFKSVIIVAMDSVDATCILLDDIYVESSDVYLAPYECLVVNKHCLLPGEFGEEVLATEEITLH